MVCFELKKRLLSSRNAAFPLLFFMHAYTRHSHILRPNSKYKKMIESPHRIHTNHSFPASGRQAFVHPHHGFSAYFICSILPHWFYTLFEHMQIKIWQRIGTRDMTVTSPKLFHRMESPDCFETFFVFTLWKSTAESSDWRVFILLTNSEQK